MISDHKKPSKMALNRKAPGHHLAMDPRTHVPCSRCCMGRAELDSVEIDDRVPVVSPSPVEGQRGNGNAFEGDIFTMIDVLVEPRTVTKVVLLSVGPIRVVVEGAVQSDRVAVHEQEVGTEHAEALRIAREVPVWVEAAVRNDGPVTNPELPGYAHETSHRSNADLQGIGDIRQAVAVVVHAVHGHFFGVRVDLGIQVVAVAVFHGEAVAIGVGVVAGQIFVDAVIAVIVHVVADFVGGGVDAGISVVAVGAVGDVALGRGTGNRRSPGAVTVIVHVEIEGGHEPFIHRAVTVVVDTIAGFGGAVVDGGVGGLAVRDVRIAVTVGVDLGLGFADISFVDGGVAVVVDGVADLGGAGVDGGEEVVAVGVVGDEAGGSTVTGRFRIGAVAVAIAVAVRVPGGKGQALVDLAVAVVIHAVADFGGAGVDGDVGVVAVGAVGDVAFGRRAGGNGNIDVPITVRIRVPVEGVELNSTVRGVDEQVTVVVDGVADLGGAGVDGGEEVVAVGAVGDVAFGRGAGEHHHIGVAVAVIVIVHEESARDVLIDVAIAVVVEAVAFFGGIGIGLDVIVVAVAVDGGVAFGSAGHEAFAGAVGIAVAVGVDRNVGVRDVSTFIVAVAEVGALGRSDFNPFFFRSARVDAEAAGVERIRDARVDVGVAVGVGAVGLEGVGGTAHHKGETVFNGGASREIFSRGIGARDVVDVIGLGGTAHEGEEKERSSGDTGGFHEEPLSKSAPR